MRRTMHALGLVLALSSTALAQESKEKLVHKQLSTAAAPGVSLMVPNTSDGPVYQTGFDQPYSPLASRMMCNDCCSDFWAGYASERSAIAARLCQSVGCGSTLHGTPCLSGCGIGCGTQSSCESNPCVKPLDLGCINRYKQPWSTLYGAPAPGMGCGPREKRHVLGHRASKACDTSPVGVQAPYGEGCSTGGCTDGGCVSGGCATLRNQQTQPTSSMAAATLPAAPANVATRATLPPTSGSWAR